MPLLSTALTKQKLGIDFASLKHACPQGIYVAPRPDEPLVWSGVMFVRKGQYANAILRFQIDFPPDYPRRPPVLAFLSDVFHPLVTPLNTYTYTARDTGADTVSAADRDHLPPGGLTLRHGFPQWFETSRGRPARPALGAAQAEDTLERSASISAAGSTTLTVQVLQYLRVIFDTEAMLDSVPLEAAANAGAWHAWKSYRSKAAGGRASPVPSLPQNAIDPNRARSSSPRQQQPGGARRPGEWNWQGVWEDRVRRSVQASVSEHILYGGDQSDAICFSKIDPQTMEEMVSSSRTPIT